MIYQVARTRRLLPALALVLLLPALAHATSFSWISPSGKFDSPGNWTQSGLPVDADGIPDANDATTFARGNVALYPVFFGDILVPNGDIHPTVDKVVIGNNPLSFVGLYGSTLTVDSTNITETARGVVIGAGAGDVAALTSTLATFDTRYATLGSAAGSSGTLNLTSSSAGAFSVSGTGATYDLIVGLNGTGTINVTNGRDVTVADDTVLGENATGVGNVTVSGDGSIWTNTGDLTVGGAGDGSLTLSAGARLISANSYLGNNAGSSGDATVTGSTWISNGDFYVGNQGSGTVSASSEAVIQSGGGYVGYAANISGEIHLDNSIWTNLATIVGYEGNGLLDIQHGSFVRTNGTVGNTIGSQAGSRGEVHIAGLNADGDHSIWRVLAGNFYVGKQGSGSLEIADGGQLINEAGYGGNDALEIGSAVGSAGEVTVSGVGSILSGFGQLKVGVATNATLDISNGAVVDSGSAYIGHDSGVTGTVTVDGAGSRWETPGAFHVGYSGNGTMTITNGGQVQNYGDHGYIAYNTNSTGAVTVDGTGTRWTLIGLHVGSGGVGTLDITNHGIVESGPITEIGGGSTGVGTVNIDGFQSHFAISSPAYSSQRLYIGRQGSGTLNITNRASANVKAADIGGSASTSDTGVGAVTVDGGGYLVIGELFVGHRGEGTLTVTNGGHLEAGPTVIGRFPSSSGTVTIDGPGSEALFDDDTFTIGEQGEGTLEILNGGKVTATEQVWIGAVNPWPILGHGTITVDGPGSLLQQTNNFLILNVGFAGPGTLEIRNGGQVTSRVGRIGNNARPQSSGIVTIDGLGSSWANTSQLIIEGNAGGATLNVTGGGTVSNTQGLIGNTSGTSGEATVDGMGSLWSNSVNLTVGSFGNGLLSVTNGGTVQTPNLIIGANGQLQGDGNIVGNVQNAGVVSPGSSPGALQINGNYTQTATGDLIIGLASDTNYDQLLVTGTATLGGTLSVNVAAEFVPSIGQSLIILTADDVDGTFDMEVFPAVPNLSFDVIYNAQSVVLTVLSALPGDYNWNGTVDAADYTVWRDNLGGTSLPNESASLGTVDDLDYDFWKTRFGETAGSGSAGSSPFQAAVPEPATLVMLFAGLLAMSNCRRAAMTQSRMFGN